MMKDRKCAVVFNGRVASGIFAMRLLTDDLPEINAGQFVQIKVPDRSFVLRRPLCISDYDEKNGTFDIIYQIKGGGTERLSQCQKGDIITALLPLGNGFTVLPEHKKVMLVGGGMGAAILPALFTQYPEKRFYTFMGFSKEELIICPELERKSERFCVTTDDGSNGNKGFITRNIGEELEAIAPDVVLCCGPEPLYRALKDTFKNFKNPVYVSLEGRMGCGIGACLTCACKIKKAGMKDTATLRVCKDGPVFGLYEVEL